MSKTFTAALPGVAALCISTGAHAQMAEIDTLDQAATVDLVNEVTVGEALSVVTETRIMNVDQQGDAYVIATAPNGLRFDVRFRACDEGDDPQNAKPGADPTRHCRGIIITSAWDALPMERADELTTLGARYQQGNPTVNAGMLPDGSPYMLRYVIADYGTRQGNLVSEFANFIRSASEFQSAIATLYEDD